MSPLTDLVLELALLVEWSRMCQILIVNMFIFHVRNRCTAFLVTRGNLTSSFYKKSSYKNSLPSSNNTFMSFTIIQFVALPCYCNHFKELKSIYMMSWCLV